MFNCRAFLRLSHAAACIVFLCSSGKGVCTDENGAVQHINLRKSDLAFSKRDYRISDGLGVVVRRPSRADFAQIAALGLKVVRMDMNWENVEKKEGVLNFDVYRKYAIEAWEQKLRILFILDYGNSIYDGQVITYRHGVGKMRARAPTNMTSIRAFANFSRAAAEALRDYNPIWEIWNEPDNAPFWPPKPNALEYVRLAEAACNGIRKSVPDAQVIGPAAGDMSFRLGRPPALIDTVVKSRLSECMDAISVHPYRMSGHLDEDAGLWQRIAALRRSGSSARFANSEWGKSLASPETQDAQAKYLIKTLSILVGLGVDINIWYNWRDFNAISITESNFGLLTASGEKKLAAIAYGQFARTVGMHKSASIYQASDSVIVKFRSDDRNEIWLTWSSGVPFKLAVPDDYKVIGVRDLYNQEWQSPSPITIGDNPVYIEVAKKDSGGSAHRDN